MGGASAAAEPGTRLTAAVSSEAEAAVATSSSSSG